MTKFHIIFNTRKGKISIYEGSDTIILKQGDNCFQIPLEDWEAFYGAIQIVRLKKRDVK